MTRVRFVLLAFLFWTSWLAACSSSPTPATQIVVRIEADATLRPSLTSIRVVVEGATGRVDGSSFIERLNREIGGTELRLPLSFPIAPLHDDSTRIFRLRVTGRSGTTDIVTSRFITGFVRGETRYISVFLENACRSTACSDTQTCVQGVCVM